MTSKTFVDFQPPVIDAAWLNDVNQSTYVTVPPLATIKTDLANTTDPTKGAAMVGGVARVVASIAVLRTLPKTGSPEVFVTGYYTQGDGGGGSYWYDSTDTTSADNGGTIIVASDGGRWKLIIKDYVSVKQFGAKGDGVTDDTTAIQAAINSTLGKLYFTGGSYVISSSLNCTGLFGLVLEGSGIYGQSNAVLLGKASIGNYPVLDLSASNGCVIRGLSVGTFGADVCFIGIMLARSGTNSAGLHVLENVSVYGNFSNSCCYSSSSEENTHRNCWYETLSAGARAFTLIDVPEAGVTSLYKNITAPSGGNTVTNFYAGRLINQTANSSNRSLFVKNARHVQFVGTYLNAGSGTDVIAVTTSTVIALRSVTIEGTPAITLSLTGACTNLIVEDSVFPVCATTTVKGETGSVVTGLKIARCTYNSISAGVFDTLYSSEFDCSDNSSISVATSKSNIFTRVPNVASIALTSSIGDFIIYASPNAKPIFAVSAWVAFTGTTGAIEAKGNMASVTRNSAGIYTLTFATPFPDTNYAIVIGYQRASATTIMDYLESYKLVGSCQVRAQNSAGTGEDPVDVSVMCIR